MSICKVLYTTSVPDSNIMSNAQTKRTEHPISNGF